MLSSNKWLKIAMFVLKTKLIHAMCKNTFEILIMFHSDNSKETIFVTVFGNSSHVNACGLRTGHTGQHNTSKPYII